MVKMNQKSSLIQTLNSVPQVLTLDTQKLTKEILGRFKPSGAPNTPEYGGAQTIFDHSPADDVDGIKKIHITKVVRCARDKMPISLSDLLMRRLGLGWEPDQGAGQARSIAEIAAPHLGWSEARIEDELVAYQAQLDTERRKPAPKSYT